MRSFFRKDPVKSQADAIFAAVVKQSRTPAFYIGGQAPDTPEGRVEMLCVHMFLALQRLSPDRATDHENAAILKSVANEVQKLFLDNMEDSLREMGVGDLVVGKKLRKMAEAFYGRLTAYREASLTLPDSWRPSIGWA